MPFLRPPAKLIAPTGHTGETAPATVEVNGEQLDLTSADFGHGTVSVSLIPADPAGGGLPDGSSELLLSADVISVHGTVQVGTLDAISAVTAPNLPTVVNGLVVPVTVPAASSTGIANFNWPGAPRAPFTAVPVVQTALVSGAGAAVHADEMLTALTAAGGTVRVDTNAVLGANTTFNVHVTGQQF